MSLKKFLQERGFVEKDAEPVANKKAAKTEANAPAQVEPTYFPIGESTPPPNSAPASSPAQPAYDVTSQSSTRVDQAFIKFFEDELEKANFPGPDYFEFRKQMAVMHQKMSAKGTPKEVILQAVLTSFEAQNIPSSKLIDTAKQYKDLLGKKKDDFLKGAGAEKEKQLQKRQTALQSHQSNLAQMQTQLQQLQTQMAQLQDMIKREQTQTEVDKTLGKEGIEKIERAEKQISLAHDYMLSAINADIEQLQSA